MFRYIILVFLVLQITGCTKDESIILANANILNMETGKVETYFLSVRGNKIDRISLKPLHGKKTIDLKGAFVMPSLWDMHVHLHGNKSQLKDYVNSGVLGVRDLGAFKSSGIDSLITWKKELESNPSTPYPEMVYAGYIHNDTACYKGHKTIKSPEDLNRSTSYLKEIGSSFYKIHNCFPKELLPELDALATENQFTFGGHVPEGIDPLQYVKQYDNINSIEHISVLVRALSYRESDPLNMLDAIALLDGPYLDSLAIVMKAKDIAFTPNILSELAFIESYPEDKKPMGEAFLKRLMAYTKRLSDHGVNILAGTDTGSEFEAGKSLVEEMELLHQAGLTNLQVLQCATINADNANGRDPNLIRENTQANFIILEEDPLENLASLHTILGVFHNGNLRLFTDFED